MQLSRRKFLKGVSLTGAMVRVGLPPLAAMFNSSGTAYAARVRARAEFRSSRGSSSGSTGTEFRSDIGFRTRRARTMS